MNEARLRVILMVAAVYHLLAAWHLDFMLSDGWGRWLPAVLGGSQPIAMQPGSVITSLTIEVLSDGVLGGQIDLPVSTFIGPDPSHWNGVLGIGCHSSREPSYLNVCGNPVSAGSYCTSLPPNL